MRILFGLLLAFLLVSGLKANQKRTKDLTSVPENDNKERESSKTSDKKGNRIFLRVTSRMKDQNTTSGRNVQFKCKVDGRPRNNIEYTWYKEDLLIDPKYDFRVSITTPSWGSRLRISNLRPLDTGLYRCEAAIGVKKVTSSAILTVSSGFPLISTEEEKPEINFPIDKCERYKGIICKDFLKSNQIFIDSSQKQVQMEAQIGLALNKLANQISVSKSCRKYALPVLCHFVFTPCRRSGNGDIKRQDGLCKESCEHLKRDVCHANQFQTKGNLLLNHLFEENSCSHLPSTEESLCAEVNFPLEDVEELCYHGTGESYKGGSDTTTTQRPCKSWPAWMIKMHPELSGHRFCRNPAKQMGQPWCFVDDDRTDRAICNVQKCEESGETSMLLYVLPCACALVLVFSIGLFVVCRRKKRKKTETSKENTEMTSVQKPLLSREKTTVPQLSSSSIHLLGEIGNGEYGKVYKGIIVNDPRFMDKQPVAVKMLDNGTMTSQLDQFMREMEVTSELRHSHVSCLKAVVLQPSHHCLLFEYTDQPNLHEYLVSNSPNSDVTEPIVPNGQASPNISNVIFMRMISQIASGMEYLSSNNYIHRDLAARNVLVCGNMDLKICNLGVVRDSYLSSYYRSSQGRLLPLRWMAPESLQSWQFSDKSPVWSFGVLLWEMFSYGLQPYCGYSNHEVLDMISRRQLLTCPDQCPAKMYSLMHECWTVQEQLRPSFNEICVKLNAWMEDRPNLVVGPKHIERNLHVNSYAETNLSVPSDYASQLTSNYHSWARGRDGSDRSGRLSTMMTANTASSQCSSSQGEHNLDDINHYHHTQIQPSVQEQLRQLPSLNLAMRNTISRDSGIPSEERDTASSFSGLTHLPRMIKNHQGNFQCQQKEHLPQQGDATT